MTPTSAKRGRSHDAEGAREAILDAAEKVFAEHGFDGARVDAIAAEAGYNKSLIFQYFDDKLGLYSAMIRRLDEQTRDMQTQVLEQLLDDKIYSDPTKIRTLLKSFLNEYFQYLQEHPRLQRIFLWEMAEGWQTYAQIVNQRDFEDIEIFKPILERISKAKLLRSNFAPMGQLIMMEFIYPTIIAFMPLYRMLIPEDNTGTPEMEAQAREFAINFILHGMLADDREK